MWREFGIAQIGAPIVGVLYGEPDGAEIKSIVNKAVKTGWIATLCFSVFVALLSHQMATLFGMTSPQQLKTTQIAIAEHDDDSLQQTKQQMNIIRRVYQ